MDADRLRQPALKSRPGWRLVGALVALAACGAPSRPVGVPTVGTTHEGAAPPRAVVPFIHDDFAAALAESERTGKPIFVDAWAPWCHTCLSLRAYVLTDPALARLKDDYVWLSIDTEKERNAGFVSRYRHAALPTLWVIDAKSKEPLLKWAGAATADELVELLTAGRAGGEASEAFVLGNRAAAAGDLAAAASRYRVALGAAPPDHPHRARVVEALVNALYALEDHAGCAAVALAEAPKLPLGTSRAVALALGLGCAREAKQGEDELAALALRDAKTESPRVLADDRSALFDEVVETKKARGDAAGAREVAAAWAAFLEAEAGRARTPAERAVFDAHRLSAYLVLGAPERAVPMLVRSERDFPEDYNPPARLGLAYLEMKRLDDAAAAVDRALSRVYGPRVMRVLALKADIAKARGDARGEAAALEDALARTEKAPLTPGQRRLRDALAKRLAEQGR